MPELPLLTFIVPVRNDAARLQRCLSAIAANRTVAPFDVIVADNGSSDASPEVARRAGATVLDVPHLSVAGVRNVASAHATGALLAFVDADHLIDAKWVDAALEIFADASVAAAGAPYSSPPDANWIQRAYDRFRTWPAAPQETDWLGSGNLVIRRDVFTVIKGFDTSLEACEDVDLCGRLRAAGYRLLVDARLRSVHLGDPRTLKALFMGELWRGRNNLSVTFRGPWTLRALPSVLIPIVNLACIAAIIGSPWAGSRLALPALLISLGLVLLRAARMTHNRTAGPVGLVQNVVVAATYEAARALALIVRATHRTRRELAGEGAVA